MHIVTGTGGGGAGGGGAAPTQLLLTGSHTVPGSHAQLTPGEAIVANAITANAMPNINVIHAAKRPTTRLIRSLLNVSSTSASQTLRWCEQRFHWFDDVKPHCTRA